MRRIALILLGLLYLLFGLPFHLSFLYAPSIEQQLKALLEDAGFENITLPKPLKTWNTVRYDTIALDPDSFSTIKNLTIKKTSFGAVTAIEIENIDLTGEIRDDFSVTLAGWNKNAVVQDWTILLPDVPLHIKTAHIALLNEKLGGITLEYALQIRPHNGTHEIQATLKGSQKQLDYTARVEGAVTALGHYDLNIDVDQAKLDLGHLRVTRINGHITLTGEYLENSEILGELEAGGLNLFALPWQKVALTLDGSPWNTRLILAAKAVGYEGIELGLTLGSLQNPAIYTGNVHTEEKQALIAYLKDQNIAPITNISYGTEQELSPLDLTFQGEEDRFTFALEQEHIPTLLNGALFSVISGEPLDGLFTGKPFRLTLTQEGSEKEYTLAFDKKRSILVRVPENTPLTLDFGQNFMLE